MMMIYDKSAIFYCLYECLCSWILENLTNVGCTTWNILRGRATWETTYSITGLEAMNVKISSVSAQANHNWNLRTH